MKRTIYAQMVIICLAVIFELASSSLQSKLNLLDLNSATLKDAIKLEVCSVHEALDYFLKNQNLLTGVKDIYQLAVPPQDRFSEFTCAYHAVRNSWHLLQLFLIPSLSCKQQYKLLFNDPKLFYGVPCKDYVTIKELQDALIAYKKDSEILEHMLFFDSFDPRKINSPGKVNKKVTKRYKKQIYNTALEIQDIEHLDKKTAEEYAVHAALMETGDYRSLLRHLEKLSVEDLYTFGIISNTKTGMSHAIGLIVHNCSQGLVYIFLDSLNLPFTYTGPKKLFAKWAQSYKITLNTLISFVEDPELIKNALIRYFYLKNKSSKDQFINELESLKLIECDLYCRAYKQFFS
jgi:hypothetical protein